MYTQIKKAVKGKDWNYYLKMVKQFRSEPNFSPKVCEKPKIYIQTRSVSVWETQMLMFMINQMCSYLIRILPWQDIMTSSGNTWHQMHTFETVMRWWSCTVRSLWKELFTVPGESNKTRIDVTIIEHGEMFPEGRHDWTWVVSEYLQRLEQHCMKWDWWRRSVGQQEKFMKLS